MVQNFQINTICLFYAQNNETFYRDTLTSITGFLFTVFTRITTTEGTIWTASRITAAIRLSGQVKRFFVCQVLIV